MKGFVPVTKSSIIAMLDLCRQETEKEHIDEVKSHVDRLIKREQERCSERRWYRLWSLPPPRFAYNADAVITWANEQEYPLFDGSPFESIEKDYDNSIRWIDSLLRVAESNHAGEPIELDINTFKRISSPELYTWVSDGRYYHSVRW